MIIKREERIYGVGDSYVVQRSSATSEAQKVTISSPGMDNQLLYQGNKFLEVFDAIGAELGKNKANIVIDVDAIVNAVDPQPAEEPVAEAPPAVEATPVETLQPA